MAKLVVEEQKDYPTLPVDSIVHMIVDSVEVRTVQGARGDWEKLEFKFKILGIQSVSLGHPSNYDNLIGEFIYGSTPFRLTDSQENKLRLWAEAILNRPLELGFELDTDYFLRREVRGVTSTYEKRAKDPNTNKPFIGHQIASLLPMGSGQATVPGQAPGAQAPIQQAPSSWGAPAQQPVQQQAAPLSQTPVDPWAAPAAQPAANDPWGQPQQQPVSQPAGQPQWEEEPPF